MFYRNHPDQSSWILYVQKCSSQVEVNQHGTSWAQVFHPWCSIKTRPELCLRGFCRPQNTIIMRVYPHQMPFPQLPAIVFPIFDAVSKSSFLPSGPCNGRIFSRPTYSSLLYWAARFKTSELLMASRRSSFQILASWFLIIR